MLNWRIVKLAELFLRKLRIEIRPSRLKDRVDCTEECTMKKQIVLLLACLVGSSLLWAAEADEADRARETEQQDRAAASAPEVQSRTENTVRKREQDAAGQTVRTEEKNRVRAGEVGSERAQQVQQRNQERKAEHAAGSPGKHRKQGQQGDKGQKGKKRSDNG